MKKAHRILLNSKNSYIVVLLYIREFIYMFKPNLYIASSVRIKVKITFAK